MTAPASDATTTIEPRQEPPRGITRRALLLGTVAVPFCNYWLIHMNSVSFNALPTTISVFYHVVFVVLILSIANLGLKQVVPRYALGQGELILLYSMLCVAAAPAGLDCILIVAAIVGMPGRVATPENRWDELVLDRVPNWLVVKDKAAATGFLEGGTTLFRPEYWGHWAGPFMAWGTFLFALWMGTLALSCVFRRRWTESERLTFPVIQLPIELASSSKAFYKQPALWWTFGLALAIDLSNGLHTVYPAFPAIPVRAGHPPFNLGALMSDPPWNAVGYFPLSFYPLVIGLSLLLPTELVFSCVAFFFYWKGLKVLSSALGLLTVQRAPWVEEQNFGGYVGLALFSVWTARRHLCAALKAVFRPGPDEAREPISYRSAAIVFALSFMFLVGFSRAAGMTVGMAVYFFMAYYAISLAIGRIRAELGLPVHDLHFAGPGTMAQNVLGSRILGPGNTIVSGLYWGFNRAYRNHPMPHQAEALYGAARTGSSQRRMFAGLVIALFLGCMTALPYYAWAGYHYGTASHLSDHLYWRANEAYGPIASMIDSPTRFDARPLTAIVFGVVTIITGMLLKTRVLWWPLHPIGFAVSGTWSMQLLWCPMLIAWAVKTCMTRYGGHHMMKRLAPIAFGLMLGDLSGGCFWAILGMLKNKEYYMIWE